MAGADRESFDSGLGLPEGTKLGRYEIRRRIAVGGQAIVYRARDLQQDRDVAIKQISSALAESPGYLDHFRREARILDQLGDRQPGIVRVVELLEDQRGLFVVTEFVEGKTVETILSESDGPCEPKWVLQVLWRLAAALHAVHGRGILHRDLKPSNIIVAEDGQPKIADFGIAGTGSGQTSMLMGTTKYMAPEVFAGRTVDGRADIYSLGMVAYEMLCGRAKFNQIFADVVRDKHTEPMRWMKWHGDPDKQAPPLHEVSPDVPLAFSDMVSGMLAKDPDERYADAEALGRAIKEAYDAQAGLVDLERMEPSAPRPLGEAVAERPAPARPAVEEVPTARLPRKPVSRRVKLTIIVCIVAVVIAAGAVAGYMHYRSASRVSHQARAIFEQGREAYDAGQYAAAMESFKRLSAVQYGETDAARKAAVRGPMCQAHLAMEDAASADDPQTAEALWQEASRFIDQARERNRTLRQAAASPSLLAWARGVSEQIEQLHNTRLDAWTFHDVIWKTRDALADERFQEALKQLNSLAVSGIQLSNSQQQQVAELRRTVEAEALRTRLENLLNEGEALTEQLKLDEAETKYDEAANTLDSERTSELLSPEQVSEYRRQHARGVEELSKMRTYADALAKAKQAEDKAAELALLETAQEAHPTDEVARRIDQLRFELNLEEARARGETWRQQADPAAATKAIKAYEAALAIRPDAQAQAELDALRQQRERWALIQAADAAVSDGRYDTALNLYAQARKLGESDALDRKVLDCKYLEQLAAGDAHRDLKEYEQARQAYRQAEQINPEKAEQVEDRLAVLELFIEFDSFIDAGEAYLEDMQYKLASNAYRKAEDLVEQAEEQGRLSAALYERLSEKIKQHRTEAQYRQYLRDGKEAMEAGQYRPARAFLKRAKDYKDTEEVRRLLEKLDELEAETF